MKVLHINDVAHVPSTLVRGLTELGVDARLEQPLTGGFVLGTGGKLSLGAKRIRDFSRLTRLIKAERCDIVHIHYAYFGVLGVIGRFPYWLHCHGTDVRRNLTHPLYGPATRLSLRRAARVLYSTPDLASHVLPYRPDAGFLPNPVDTDRFRPPERERDEPSLLLIVRLDPAKGIEELFAALRVLASRHPQLRIDAFSWGPMLDQLRGEPIRFLPKASYADMPSIIAGSTIVLGQVGIGSVGQSELEAMACGRPVVCDFRNIRDYSEPPPHLQARTAPEIVEAVEALLATPSLGVERGRMSREWVEKHHGYRSVARQLLELYREWTALQSVSRDR